MTKAWLLLAAALAGAAPAGAETLGEAVRKTIAGNPTLAAAQARQDALAETPEQARSLGRLTAEADAGAGYDRFDYGRGGVGSASATLPIWTGGRVASALRATSADVAAGGESVRGTLATVLFDVVAAYADLLLQQQALAIAEAQIKLLDDQVAESNARFTLGTGTLTDVARLTAQRDAAKSTRASAEAAREAAAARYRAVVGNDAGVLAAPSSDLQHLPNTRDEARGAASAQNPLVRQAVAARDAAAARIDVARANSAPSVDLTGTYGYGVGNRSGLDGGYNRAAAIGLSLRVPLLTGGLVASQVRQARASARAAAFDVEAAGRDATRAADTAWANLAAARARVTADTSAVTAAEKALAGIKAEYGYGLRTTLDIVIADQSLRGAQLSLAASRSDLMVYEASLLAAVGALDQSAFAEGGHVAASARALVSAAQP
ncbi:TolC family outer membrane protein [Sphingomonas sp. Mn802worker]|uniref:TolC family outer membrane protein n=1 Tax=Sphingomonas sp. Mn802worker TaxID=629773 RepID=UPI0005674CF2|nr:TolC family outer membrane protein [Sphingomonas sp. Mn802worker]